MKDSVIKKLKQIVEQYHSIGNQLLDEETQKNNALMIELSKKLSRLEPVVKLFEKQQQLVEERNKTAEIIDEKDEKNKRNEEIKNISEIFDIDGEKQFRKMETKQLKQYSESIVACGGGIVLKDENR